MTGAGDVVAPLETLIRTVTGGRVEHFLEWFYAAIYGNDPRCGAVLGGIQGAGRTTLFRVLEQLYSPLIATIPPCKDAVPEERVFRGWSDLPPMTRIGVLDGATFGKGGHAPRGFPWLADPAFMGQPTTRFINKAALVGTNDAIPDSALEWPGRRWALFSASVPLGSDAHGRVMAPFFDGRPPVLLVQAWRAFMEGRSC